MKKIIAFTLVLVTALSVLIGCAGNKGIDEINECYARSYPHKIVVESTQQFGSKSLFSITEIVRGKVGADEVSKKVSSLERLRSIEDGSGVDVYGPIETVKEEIWYRDGKGISFDKGNSWDETGVNFFPEKGGIAIDLKEDLMDDVNYEDGKLSFTVAKNNTKAFFGNNTTITEKVTVEIITGGGFVTEVKMSWVEPENTLTGVEMTNVSIKAQYIYDQQNISLD